MKKYLNTNSLEFLGVSEISNINDFNGNNLVITEDVDIELTLAEDEALDVTIFTNGNRLRLSSELGTSIRGGATFPQKTRLRITRGINSEAFAVQSSPSDLTLVDFGGGLEGSQYVFVTAEGTDEENATELQSAYNTAKTMSPSATNRITVICGNGNYDFEDDFVMDTQYIDLVSLDGNRSIIFNGTGTINITANDVFVKGVDVGTKKFTIGNDLNLLKVENCQGGDDSFGGFFSFGGNGLPVGTTSVTASGTFTNCQGGDFSFGGSDASFGGTASGTFTNCQGGDSSFGGNGGTASGTFTNCQGGDNSFGDNGTASGTFTNCVGSLVVLGEQHQELSQIVKVVQIRLVVLGEQHQELSQIVKVMKVHLVMVEQHQEHLQIVKVDLIRLVVSVELYQEHLHIVKVVVVHLVFMEHYQGNYTIVD